MIRFSMRALTISHFAIASALLASPALAQTATQAQTVADEPAPGEIVVTAAKRSENLQAVPISITAIGGDNLARAKVNSVDSLVTKVVNLQLTSIVGDNTPIFALRGVSMSDYSLNQSRPITTKSTRAISPSSALPCTIWRGSKCCADRRARFMARTPPAARST